MAIGASWLRARCWNSGDTAENCIANAAATWRELRPEEAKLIFCSACVAWPEPMVEAAQKAGMEAEFVATPEEAGDWLARETREGDVVLLKASRGVKLEKALETWKQKIGHPDAHAAGN